MKSIGLKKALVLMARKSCLVKMHTPASPEGFAWYVVPGGHISHETAALLLKRPDVKGQGDGLMRGHDQTWRMI